MKAFKIRTDETLRETIRHGDSSFPFAYYLEDIWQFDFHRIDWHWHHELEFVYVTKGSATCFVGTEKILLKKGCGIFVNSGILHRYESDSSVMIPNIVFSPSLLAPEKSMLYEKYIQPVLASTASYLIFDPQEHWQNQILQNLIRIFNLQEPGSNSELQTIGILLQIWDILFKHIEFPTNSNSFQYLNYQQARLQTMMQYVHDNYAKALTLNDIATAASISKSGALHIFQSYIHNTPVAYLIQYRLSQAAQQLCTTEDAISVIARENGFATTGYFCRKFKQFYFVTPNEYRRNKLAN